MHAEQPQRTLPLSHALHRSESRPSRLRWWTPCITNRVRRRDAPTTLTPDPPPLCGDFGRPYIAPESTGQTQPATPPPGLGTLNVIQSRIAREGEGFELYAAHDQELIRNGRARVGLDERAAYLAHGLPAFYWNVSIDDQPCRVMMYGVLGNEEVDTTVYTCNGLVTTSLQQNRDSRVGD